MSGPPLPSLGRVLAETQYEREAQLKHFDSLDSKAGILLGFAGALVALSPPETNAIVDGGRIVAVVAAGAALWAFWPRTYPITNLRVLRDRYLTAHKIFTERRVLDTHIEMTEVTARALGRKAERLKLSMSALALAAALVAIGLVVT